MKKMYDVSDHGSLAEAIAKSDQVIDLGNVDTTLYNWKFKRMINLPVGSYDGYPLVIGDFNNDNITDILGSKTFNYKPVCAIVEIKNDTTYEIKKIYSELNEYPLAFTDVDHDGLGELNIRWGRFFRNYESLHLNSYPDTLRFIYKMWWFSGIVGAEKFYDLDKDGWMDIFYPGDDLLPPHGQKLYVAEYDSSINNFVKKFRYEPEDWDTYGSSIGDFDGDGFTEFFTASVHGRVYGFENTGNDSYRVVYEDTISAPNAYLNCATDDIDRNGKPEFFIGGTAFYQGIPATRIYWFEADRNNHYLKKRSLFLLNSGFFGVHELYGIDVNMDDIKDLFFVFPLKIVILTWNLRGFFELFFLDITEQGQKPTEGANIYDTFHSGRPDLYVCGLKSSKFYVNNYLAGIGKPTSLNIANFKLLPNYPNPFNPSTTIEFSVPNRSAINITIYDITGKEVIRLIENKQYLPGKHKVVWNGTDIYGKEVSSGVYLTEMKTGSFREVRKMLLIR